MDRGPVINVRIDESRLQIQQPPIAAGGTAEILRCRFEGQARLYKRYRPQYLPLVDARALDRLVQWRAALPAAERQKLDKWCAWPTHTVQQGSALVGLLMPSTPPVLAPSDQPARTLSDLRRLDPDLPDSDLRAALVEAITAFGRTAEVVLWLHSRSVVVNDVQPLNVLVSPDHSRAYLIDCDAMIGPWGSVGPPAAPAYFNDLIADPPSPAVDLAKLAWCMFFVLLDDFSLRQLGHDVQREAAQYLQSSTVSLLVRSAMRSESADRLRSAWQERASAWITAGEQGLLILDDNVWLPVKAAESTPRIPQQALTRSMVHATPTVPLTGRHVAGRASRPLPTVPTSTSAWSNPAAVRDPDTRRGRVALIAALIAVALVLAVVAAVYLDILA